MRSPASPRYDRDDVLLSTHEAALLASCRVDDVLAAVIRGQLPAVSVGDGVRVPRPALVATLRARHSLDSSLGWAS